MHPSSMVVCVHSCHGAVQIFEMTAGVFMVEARKAAGDTLEYHKVSTAAHCPFFPSPPSPNPTFCPPSPLVASVHLSFISFLFSPPRAPPHTTCHSPCPCCLPPHQFYRALLARVSDMVCHDTTYIAPSLAPAPLAPATLPTSPPDTATCPSAPSPGISGKPGVVQEAKPGVARDEVEQLMEPQQAESPHRRPSLDEGRIAPMQAHGSVDGERGRRRSMDETRLPVADVAAGEATRRDEALRSPAKARSLDFWPGSLMSSVLQSPLFKARSASPSSPSCNSPGNDPPALSLAQLHSFSCSCSGPMCHCRAAVSCSADRSGGGDGRGEGCGETEAVHMQQVM
ncbi:unnamed protein product [Closterium sp. Yama58-4]|nr:unnamed protein product [Closterium sp. Yama58-4]